MVKLAAFDLDSTLAGLGKGVPYEVVGLLRQLEQMGTRIALCSGKSVDYLCGLMRQIELNHPILMGENGAVIQLGVDLPPKDFHILPYSDTARESIARLRREITRRLPHIWFQADMVGITPFPVTDEEFDIVTQCIDDCNLQDVDIYRHCDSFDIVPKGTSKGRGLEFICELLNIDLSQTATIGDGVNDYPMFDAAGIALGVNVLNKSRVDRDFTSASEAIQYLMKNCGIF